MTNEEALAVLQHNVESIKKVGKTPKPKKVKSLTINNQLPKIKVSSDRNKYEGQYVQVPFGLFRDIELYDILHKCIPIYLFLQSCVFRGAHRKDKFSLYEKFYRKGILAVSIPNNEIARRHGHGPNKTREILNLLEKYGFIKKEKITTKYKKSGKWVNGQQNIFILGTHFMGKPKYLTEKIDFCEVAIDG